MLYLAIDQHKNYLTINIRNEQGDVRQKWQVSTAPADIDDFFVAFAKRARKHRGYMAIVEVCVQKGNTATTGSSKNSRRPYVKKSSSFNPIALP